MPERITKTQRWLDLIALLLGRQIPLAVEEIMERVPAYAEAWRTGDATAQASARRMFERDKDELRKMGIPIETVRYEINYGREALDGYRITRRDFYLPYLRVVAEGGGAGEEEPGRPYSGLPGVELEPSDAHLALEALRRVEQLPAFPFAEEARSALRKLTFDLDAERYPGAPVVWVERPGAREVLESLRILSDALLSRKRVRFLYHGIYRGEATERDVAPFGLFFHRDWYLVGHDAARDAARVFRVSRMESLQANARSPKRPDYEIPSDFDLRAYVDRSAWELGEEAIPAEVLFHFPASVWASRNAEGELVEERSGGAAVRRFSVSQVNPFLRWLLSLAGDAEILSPPELREEYLAMAAETAVLHGGADG
jgi:proteasome accessory factor B